MMQWSAVAGTTAPMNMAMYLRLNGTTPFLRAANQPIVSETYIHMWEPNHTLPASTVGGTTGGDRSGLGVAVSNAAGCTTTDDPNNVFNNTSPAKWCATGTPSAAAPRSIMYAWGGSIAITSYRITSAADLDTRDPRDWTFQGCAGTCTVGADAGWVTLDTRSNEAFASRLLSRSFSFSNTTAYGQYRLRVTANKGNVAYLQLREIQLFDSGGPVVPLPGVDRTENGTVSWVGKPCSGAELPTRAFDNLMTAAGATRWCVASVPTSIRPAILGYTWAAPTTVTSYRLTSASDYPARDPRTWVLQGCDGTCKIGQETGWVTLDTRTGETFASRYQTKAYTLAAPGTYRQYRLQITANNGDTAKVQVGELQLF
jgi:alpha-L-fucosidase 2